MSDYKKGFNKSQIVKLRIRDIEGKTLDPKVWEPRLKNVMVYNLREQKEYDGGFMACGDVRCEQGIIVDTLAVPVGLSTVTTEDSIKQFADHGLKEVVDAHYVVPNMPTCKEWNLEKELFAYMAIPPNTTYGNGLNEERDATVELINGEVVVYTKLNPVDEADEKAHREMVKSFEDHTPNVNEWLWNVFDANDEVGLKVRYFLKLHAQEELLYHKYTTVSKEVNQLILKELGVNDIKHLMVTCTHNGKTKRLTGSSRMGDVWLRENLDNAEGYDYAEKRGAYGRVNIKDLTDFKVSILMPAAE